MPPETTTGQASDPPILDAASILLVDGGASNARLLMGLRRPDNVFLPNKWVFPGGRLEASDRDVVPASEVDAADAVALSFGLQQADRDDTARALALAAVRELYEETGHALARSASDADDLEALWPEFRALRLRPNLAALSFIARAITPPGRPRRYDTRFFVARRQEVIEDAGPADGEFSDFNWFTLAEARALDLPNITRRVLDDLEGVLADAGRGRYAPVPFYFQADEAFRRDLIPRQEGLGAP